MKHSLHGEHAIVTGGAAGIGLELAKACLQRGASVSIVDLARDTNAAAAELARAVPAEGAPPSFQFYRADVGNFAEVQRIVKEAEQVKGPTTILIPNAGVPGTGNLLWDDDVEDVERINRINYLGVMYTLKAALPNMVQRRAGRVLLVSSLMASLGGYICGSCYGGPKAAIRCIAMTLEKELMGSGVTVSLLQPGFVNTPMTRAEQYTFHANATTLAKELHEEFASKPHDPAEVAELAMQALESGRFLVKSPDAASSLMIAAGATHPRMNSWLVEVLLSPFYTLMYLYIGCFFDKRIMRWRRKLWSDSAKAVSVS